MDRSYITLPTVEQDLSATCNSRCCYLVDGEGYISLANILAMYNSPINEDHAWALCYLSAKYLETHSLLSRTSRNGHVGYPMLCSKYTELIKIHHANGHVALDLDINTKTDTEVVQRDVFCEKRLPIRRLIPRIALIIYHALDFGIREDEERSLSEELESLLELMESSGDSSRDRDVVLYADTLPSRKESQIVESDVINACLRHFENIPLSNGESADYFYQRVCRDLALDTLEFAKFLHVAERESKTLRWLSCPSHEDLLLYRRSEHKVKWIHVVRELRRGVTLKRLDESIMLQQQREFKKTPYELLMDDIKSQKYKLKKVSESLDGKVKGSLNNVHDIIMEHIRSRTLLRKVANRMLKPVALKKVDPHEELMKSIRQPHYLRSVAETKHSL